MPIEKQENEKIIKYKIRLTDNVRFMASSLSNLTDNLAEDLSKGKCKDCKSSLEYMTIKSDILTFKCMHYNKMYEERICNGDMDQFCLMLRKGLYPYE